MTFGSAANEAIKGLSASPVLLMVVLLNVVTLGLIFYVGASQRDERAVLTKYIIDCQQRGTQ